MSQTAPYIFHGHDVSYFSGKVRPAFAQKSLWMREVLPDILEIKRRTGLHYFPAVETPDGDMWQDTSDILDQLEAAHPDPPLFPATPVQRIVAYLIELYGDEMGILPAMHYRWSFEESIAKVGVDFSTPTGDEGGGAKFAERMKSALPMLGVTPQTVPGIEAHTRELLDHLSAHFRQHRYLLGDAMSLADCGLMGPFYGHLYRDAVPERLLYQTAFHVCAWIERTNRPPRDQAGWLKDDRLAETLGPVLRTMADAVPMVAASIEATDTSAAEQAQADEAVPNATGLQQSTYRGVALSAAARPYTLWMVQRPLDAYRDLHEAERAQVDAALAGTGWEKILALRPRHRVEKRNYQLVWESQVPAAEPT
ncbi:MAG: glutathione S-transferase family protein [bacterium]|nr:glutathione S-transferase family protein [bacterium]